MAKSLSEDDVLRKMLKTPPKPFTPKAKAKTSRGAQDEAAKKKPPKQG
ncbi:MAG: hypothetical protein J0H61_13005 [Alphaproteobacteria bacterium]|nr:hypothetical protein [Alphaproteobacteria bacterium]